MKKKDETTVQNAVNEAPETAHNANESAQDVNKTASDAIFQQSFLRELLEKQLEDLTRRKNLADRRFKFLNKKSSLVNYRKAIDESVESLETPYAKIIFVGQNEYGREEERFNVCNPANIVRYIDVLIEDIDLAVAKIEAEIMQPVI